METEYRELIVNKSEQLAELINLDVLMPFIISEKIFTVPMLEDIYNEESDHFRKQNFLDELPTRGPKAFDSFVKALKMAGQEAAAELLEKNIPDHLISKENEANQSKFSQVSSHKLPVNTDNNENQPSKPNFVDEFVVDEINATDIYTMNSTPRGYCLIVNNVHFNDLAEIRLGSDLDARRLDTVFQYLGYIVYLRSNLTEKAMKTVFYDFSKKKEHGNVDSCVVIILSHGFTGLVYGTDLEIVYINEILEMFDNKNCPNLLNKPKLFFIQACRGGDYDSGVMKTESKDALRLSTEVSPPSVSFNDEVVPTYTDMLLSYSTIEGYISIRDHHLGSWYCQALCNVLKEHASKEDLNTMLRLVDREVKNRIAGGGEKQATERTLKGWDKRFFFNVK